MLLAPTVGANQPGINNLAGAPELHQGVNGMNMNTVSAPPPTTQIDQADRFGSDQIQRPAGMANRTAGQFSTAGGLPLWSQQQQQQQHISPQNAPPVRRPFVASERSLGTSDRSNSAQEVEELLGSQGRMQRKTHFQGGWAGTSQSQQQRGKPCILPLYHLPECSRTTHSICLLVGKTTIWDV